MTNLDLRFGSITSSMASSLAATGKSVDRPYALVSRKSFPRMESLHSNPVSRSRASTLKKEPLRESLGPLSGVDGHEAEMRGGDIFEKQSPETALEVPANDLTSLDSSIIVQQGFDQLPIEIISLTDR